MRTGPSRSDRPAWLFRRAVPALLLGGLVALASLPGQAQDTPRKAGKAAPGGIDLDALDPRPDGGPENERLVNLSRSDPAFKTIRDNRPLADDPKNKGELGAFLKTVKHALRTPQKSIERYSRKYIQYADLAGELREQFLTETRPIRVSGKLVRLRLIDPDALLRRQTGVEKLYEGWLLADEKADQPVCVVFGALPPGLRTGEALDERVTFDGWYFKFLGYTTKELDANGKAIARSAPLLVGRSIAVAEPESAPATGPDEAARVRLAKGHEVFNAVLDKRPVASLMENYGEYTAYGLVFRHAHQFAPEVLARHSRKDVIYADLIADVREQFLRELLHVEGRLVRLRQREASERLRDTSQIKHVYEGWIYHENEYRHPVCVAFTELPEGIKPGETLSYRVAFDGYYFKLMAYPSQEKDEKGKDVWRVAPLLIGRKLELRDDHFDSLSDDFVPMVLLAIAVIGIAGLAAAVYFRRGDRRVREHVEQALAKENPFDDAPPPVQPGDAWGRPNEP